MCAQISTAKCVQFTGMIGLPLNTLNAENRDGTTT